LRTYSKLDEVASAFAVGKYPTAILLGSPEVGKSSRIIKTMNRIFGPPNHRWSYLKGHHTPLDFYSKAYEFSLRPIILDDLDALLKDPKNTPLLKSLCETRPIKQIQWGSSHRAFKPGGLLQEFISISDVALIANAVQATNSDILAIADRTAVFQPSNLELHREVATGTGLRTKKDSISLDRTSIS
jgi:hypothetical protein